jgi:hypothetical protein
MKRILLGLVIVAVLASATTPAMARGRYPRGWRAGVYAGYAPRYNPYAGGHYRPRRVYYPTVPVYAPYRPYRPRQGFSYYGRGFSFSVGR